MKFDEIAAQAQALPYRDKFRLAQLLLQTGRKEEEEAHPAGRVLPMGNRPTDPELLRYVFDRLVKLRPGRKEGALNSIGAMFQFQGGIADADKEKVLHDLCARKLISISEDGRIHYAEPRT